MKSLFLLFISLSFVACLPMNLSTDESYFSQPVKELPHVESSVSHNTEIDIYPKTVLVVVDTKPIVAEPSNTNESFVGPPISIEMNNTNINVSHHRKLLNDDTADNEDSTEEDYINTDDDDDEDIDTESQQRHLLRSKAKAPAPAPAPAPKPKPAPAPAPAPKVKSAPTPAPPAPKVKSAPTPAPAPKVKDNSKSKSSKSSSKHNTKSTDNTHRHAKINDVRKQNAKLVGTVSAATTKALEKREKQFNEWLVTDFGVASAKFCKGLGIKDKVQIYAGCLEDMMMTKDKKLAEESAIAAEEFLSKAKTTPSKKFCVASGDPHFTNYDGAYFHLQEPGMYTIAKSADNSFEVQERMKKNGRNVPGVPSCMTGAAVKYGSLTIEIDTDNYGRVLVNGQSTELPQDFTLNVGGASIRYGKQSVEWRGEKATASGLKITGRNGFNIFIEGRYCGVLEVNVPQEYFGKMEGICGNADGKRDGNDFADGYGKTMNVNYGTKNWEMSGYGGPTSPLSKWQLAWKALGTDCLFKVDCEKGASLRKTSVVVVPVSAARKVDTPSVVASDSKQIKVIPSSSSSKASIVASASKQSSASPSSSSSKASIVASASKQSSASPSSSSGKAGIVASTSKQSSASVSSIGTSTASAASVMASVSKQSISSSKSAKGVNSAHVSRTISKGKTVISKHMTSIRKHINDLLSKLVKEQTTELNTAKKNFDFSQTQADDIYKRYKLKVASLNVLKQTIEKLDVSIQRHFKAIEDDNAYLARLKLMKPKFLETLNILNSHTDLARSSVEGTIVRGADKDAMLSILRNMNIHIKSMTANVSDAFMEHYRKYEKQLNVDQLAYNDVVEQLRKAKIQLTDNTREEKEILAEYNRAIDVVQKLRATATLTEEESQSLSGLERILKNVIENGKTTQCFT
jgi:hypothetical protein